MPYDDVVLRDSNYDDFYRAHFRSVVGLGYVLTGSLGAAEDLAQEAFIAAHRQSEKLIGYDELFSRTSSSPAPWEEGR